MHRNIKPSNILVREQGKWEIRLIDFDFAKELPSGQCLYEKVTHQLPQFEAPEVFKGTFNEKCDIWSIGCILYSMLCGHMPFRSKTDDAKEIAELISVGDINLEGLAWKGVSADAKDMVRYLMTYEMNDRPSS